MLKRLEDFCQCLIQAKDGEIGKIVDFYFDENEWDIRYFVIETGSWHPAQKILLSPRAFYLPDETKTRFYTHFSLERIKHSPVWNKQPLLSRHYERALSDYYGWQPYWISAEPESRGQISELYSDSSEAYSDEEPNLILKSALDVSGYQIEALDGSLGRVDDFVADILSWKVRYMIVDTNYWIAGRKVLIAPDWIEGLDWEDSKVLVALDKESIRKSPLYDAEKLDRHYEQLLYRYYGRKKYWEEAHYKKSA
jgi:hypothetical protein